VQTQERSVNERWALTLTSLPGLVGLSLGAIYGLGAVQTTAQFRGAGLHAADLFPLIPLNQILSRGIALAIYPYGVLVFMLLVLLFGLHYMEPIRKRRERKYPLPDYVRRRIVALVLIAALVWSFFFAGWLTWIIAPPLLAFLHFGGRWAQERVGKVRGLFLASIFLVVVLGAATAIITPDPLPKVELSMRDGTSTTGELVASTGQTWYFTYGDAVRAVPENRVKEAVVSSEVDHVDERSLWTLIKGLF
jgi:magnesium-transporting ATPase (P-type)